MTTPNSNKRQKTEDSRPSLADILDAMPYGLYPFLSVNDATNLGVTCRANKTTVDTLRRPATVSIIREERIPTKIGYENTGENEPITVFQVQRFRFRLGSSNSENGRRVLELHAKLFNSLWNEEDNRHLGAYRPSRTKLDFCIYQGHLNHAGFLDATFVYNDKWGHCGCNKYGCFYCAGFRIQGLEPSDDKEGPYVIPPEFEDNARLAMSCFWACAKQIASFPDGTSYPSAAYLMHRLPEILHPYFPNDFDWDAPFGDRKMKKEFGYHPACCLEHWHEYMPPEFDGIYEYDLGELPWYAE